MNVSKQLYDFSQHKNQYTAGRTENVKFLIDKEPNHLKIFSAVFPDIKIQEYTTGVLWGWFGKFFLECIDKKKLNSTIDAKKCQKQPKCISE